jgi:orotate phosphoribosyltransferase
MQEYQREFIRFAVDLGVLRFGAFTLKSGRQSPYFFNSGLFDTGASLGRLGRFYARAILAAGALPDMLFGPAYKGIPLVSSIAIALAEQHGHDLPYAFDRKEAKHHAEGGVVVGAPLRGRVLIVDDVISAGTSVRQAVSIIRAAGAQPVGVAIALDRRERGRGELSAVQEVEREYGLSVSAIVRLEDIIDYLAEQPGQAPHIAAIREYLARYGAAA